MNSSYSMWAGKLLVVGAILIVSAPILLTNYSILDFTNTGQIGDTIGGITAPITGLIGSILVYFALQAQIDANRLIQIQIEEQKKEDAQKKQLQYISELYSYFTKSIDSFTYATEERTGFLKNSGSEIIVHKGNDAIEKFVGELRSYTRDAHSRDLLFVSNAKYVEFQSILHSGKDLIENLKSKSIPLEDKNFFKSMIEHQMKFRIYPHFQQNTYYRRDNEPCSVCGAFHDGVPVELEKAIQEIKESIASF